MQDVVLGLARGLATNTSRRGFMARASYLLLGLVGGSALLELMRDPAVAFGQERRYPTQAELLRMSPQQAEAKLTAAGCCFHWYSCRCSPRLARWYDCPCSCPPQTCSTYFTCSNLYC